jgi:hypothetical protein
MRKPKPRKADNFCSPLQPIATLVSSPSETLRRTFEIRGDAVAGALNKEFKKRLG